MTAQDVIRRFELEPLAIEGGYFRQSWRGASGGDGRLAGTAIYYLLTPDTCSRMHRLPTDEVYHFYLGDPVELLLLWPDGSGKTVLLGREVEQGMEVQFTVPAGAWQGSRLAAGGSWGLLGTTMAPGYADEDFVLGDGERLKVCYPAFAEQIEQRA